MVNCQACKKEPVQETVESEYPDYPYRLCSGCARRIYNYALRPREWYNLACLFGPGSFALHEDFYDKKGKTYAAQIPVEEPERHPAPSLDMVRDSPEELVDYAIAHEGMHEPEVAVALRNIDRSVLLELLTHLVVERSSMMIKCFAYEIAAKILKNSAADLVRFMCETTSSGEIYSMAFAVAQCLPVSEAFDKIIKGLEIVDPSSDLAQFSLLSLSELCCKKTLEWIPNKVSSEVSNDWGRLAAISQLSWPVLRNWLASGRPMSWVALDALNATHHYDTPLLEKIRPKLLDLPSESEFLEVLESYRRVDAIPRVNKAIDLAIRNMEKILDQTHSE